MSTNSTQLTCASDHGLTVVAGSTLLLGVLLLLVLCAGGAWRAISYPGLLGEEPGGWSDTFSGSDIYSEPENKVDLGVLRGADHDGHVLVLPFSMGDGVLVKFKVTL